MLRNTIYYRVKPLIPQSLRMMIRRKIALRLRERVTDVWPIMPGSERKPDGWPGWPEGKQFAVVLSHDVESEIGLQNVRRLAELERSLGFKSSFNFIPEGSYRVSRELREELTQNGWEVGVHDLKHDGRLYSSRHEFKRNAQQINAYLKEWGAVGFRSGFMLHNLDWVHDFDISYDASTFDTDPFEPQPRGLHTIFPFWVPSPHEKTEGGERSGYVELPYTLPQDSTLFLLLRETSIDVWKKKVDWIAEHGGMALVNVHPDYVRFDGEPQSRRTYPAAWYQEFLEHLRSSHEGAYWQALPKQIAHYVARLEPRPTVRRSRRVCMVTHSFYESDNRVTRYAEALAARGDHVDVVALRRSLEVPTQETSHGVKVYRIQNRFDKSASSQFAYLWPLLRFLRASSRWVTSHHRRQPYDLLHIHNLPDFMVFSAWYPNLAGASIILDIHDIVPEFYANKFGKPCKGVTFTLLRWMERLSARLADHVIIANDLWLDKYATRTRTTNRCTVFINNVDTQVFTPRPRRSNGRAPIVLFPGGLQWHQGVDIALRAFKQAKEVVPDLEFHIYGDGVAKNSLVALAAELGLNGSVRFFKTRGVREIAAVMATADLGVVPKRADSFGNEAYSTKIMEFMSVGVPVVVSETKVDRHYFNDSVVRFFPSGDVDRLAGAMLEVLQDPQLRERLVRRASEFVVLHSWESRRADYLDLVDRLCEAKGRVMPN